MATKKPAAKAAVKKVAASPAPKTIQARQRAEEKRWQAQDDLRTMQRAQEVAGDPERLKAAQKEAQQQVQALQKVAGKK